MALLAPGLKVLSAPVPAELHKRLRIRALEEERTVSEVLVDAVSAYLRRSDAS